TAGFCRAFAGATAAHTAVAGIAPGSVAPAVVAAGQLWHGSCSGSAVDAVVRPRSGFDRGNFCWRAGRLAGGESAYGGLYAPAGGDQPVQPVVGTGRLAQP